MRSIVFVLFAILFSITSFAVPVRDDKQPPDIHVGRPALQDASQCEEVREVRGMQLCKKAHSDQKVRLPNGTVKPPPSSGVMNPKINNKD